MNDLPEPTRLQMLVAEINNRGTSDYHGAYKQVPFRIQPHLYAKLTAVVALIESNQKTSRNKVLNDLLEIALDQVYNSLSPDLQNGFDQLYANAFSGALQYIESGDLSDD
jgi:hypothetical protein